jgi:single-strand DNA-binding protein
VNVNPCNLVVLCGHVSSPPRSTELPSGSELLHLEVTTRVEGSAVSVPVVWLDPTTTFQAADEVVVVGQVRRRFFRAGGATASRTEVVAESVVRASRTRESARAVERAIARAVGAPGGTGG